MASIWHFCLWNRQAAAALIQLLAWKPPKAVGVAQKKKEKKKKKEEEEEERKEGRKERKKQIEKEHEKDYQI